MGKEDIDLRFGVVAVQKGFITKDKILKASEIQLNEDFSIGKYRLISRILLYERLITHTQFDEVLDILLTTRENGTDKKKEPENYRHKKTQGRKFLVKYSKRKPSPNTA